MSTVKSRLERVEKEAEKQEPQEPYVVEYKRDGQEMICKRGDKVVARVCVNGIDLRTAI